MEAAPAAIPVNPKTAAMMATTRNMTVQRNIKINFWLINNISVTHLPVIPVLAISFSLYTVPAFYV